MRRSMCVLVENFLFFWYYSEIKTFFDYGVNFQQKWEIIIVKFCIFNLLKNGKICLNLN